MTKYSSSFKLKVVKEYMQGHVGADTLAKKYHIASVGGLRGWIQAYRVNGAQAFDKVSREKRVYSQEFKENAVQLYLSTELTYQEVSNQLGIQTIGLVCTWVNQFREYGVIPEPQKHGRKLREMECLPQMTTSKTKDEERIKLLEKQLRYAQLEIEYLKGLRRLEKKAQINKKQSSLTISEKNSNSKKF